MSTLPINAPRGGDRPLPLPSNGSRIQRDRSILYDSDVTLDKIRGEPGQKSFLARLAMHPPQQTPHETLEGTLYFDREHYRYLERQDLNFLEVHILIGAGLKQGASCSKEGHNCVVERTIACFKAYMVIEFGQTPYRAEHHQYYYTAAVQIQREACERLLPFTAGVCERLDDQSDALVNVMSLDDDVLQKRFQEIFQQRIGSQWEIHVRSVEHTFRGSNTPESSRSIEIISQQGNRIRGFSAGLGLTDGRAFTQPVSTDSLEKEVMANLIGSMGNTQTIQRALFQLREIHLVISNDLTSKHVEYMVDRSVSKFISAGQVARLVLMIIPAVGQSFAIAANAVKL